MSSPPASLGARFTILHEIASGGMATVYLGRLAGPGGFSRLVAIKRPHPHVARHPEFRAMLLDEGRIAASIHHPNVVSTLDVVSEENDLFLVMEYVPGRTLGQIQKALRQHGERMPPSIACAIGRGVLLGLAAVHEARDEHGAPLGIVHRDVSPQNILVGDDGVPRVLDFGVAKAAGRLQITREGQLKGKIAYMAPEQTRGAVTSRTDLFAASIVLWEALTGRRLFTGEDEVEVLAKALTSRIDPPSRYAVMHEEGGISPRAWSELDAVVLCGLAREPAERFASAKEMAEALARCVSPLEPAAIAAWLRSTAKTENGEAKAGNAAAKAVYADTTVDEQRIGVAPATLTGAAGDVLAVRVRPETPRREEERTSASSPSSALARPAEPMSRRSWRRRVGVLAGGGLIAVAGAVLIFARAEGSPRPASPAVGTTATPIEKHEPPPEGAGTTPSPQLPPVVSVAPVVSTDASSPAPRTHVKPFSKNRAERPHVPLPSETVDVSHAIDQRH